MSAKKRVKLELDGDSVHVDEDHPVFEDTVEDEPRSENEHGHEHSHATVSTTSTNGSAVSINNDNVKDQEQSTETAGQSNAGLVSNENDADFEREKMRLLLSNFNEDQMARYEAYRRANINRGSIKKLANSVLNQSITGNVAVALSGMSKVFVGEIVEKARSVQLRMDHVENNTGDDDDDPSIERPILPKHLREAWRLYKQESGTVPAAHWRRQGGADGTLFR